MTLDLSGNIAVGTDADRWAPQLVVEYTSLDDELFRLRECPR